MRLFSNLKLKKIRKSIEKYPDVFGNYRDLIGALLREGDLEEALVWIDRARQREWAPEERAWLRLKSIDVAAQRGPDPGLLREALEIASDTALNFDTRGKAAMTAGNILAQLCKDDRTDTAPGGTKAALLAITDGLAPRITDPEVRMSLYLTTSEIAETANDTERALAFLDKAIETAEKARMKNRSALFFRAGMMARRAALPAERVKRYFDKAVEDGSLPERDMIRALFEIGNALKEHEDILGAMDRYETALRFAGKHDDALTGDIRAALARTYYETGRFPQAESEVEAVFALDAVKGDKRAALHAWWSEVLREREDGGGALTHIEAGLKAVETPALRAQLHALAAGIYLGMSRPEEAVESLKKALEHAPPEDRNAMRLKLCRALRLSGDLPAADNLLKTLRNDPAYTRETAALDLEAAALNEARTRVIKALELYLKVIETGNEKQQEDATRAIHRLKRELSAPDGMKKFKLTGSDRKRLAILLARSPEEEDFFDRLKKGLFKTKESLIGGLERILSGRSGVDDEVIDEVEELLILSDIGVDATRRIMEGLRDKLNKHERKDPDIVRTHIREQIEAILRDAAGQIEPADPPKPFVMMVVGVNGVGKTTTIAKIARRFTEQGRSVLLAAGDTFRAGAIEQLREWGRRLNVDVIAQTEGSDPSAVAWDAVAAAKNRDIDVLIVDTAGRLHTKYNLMEELKKVHRVIGKNMPGAPHEVLLVLDATNGQNAVTQAKIFSQAVNVTGIALTKLDGTAKGGIIISIVETLHIPIKLIGIGERMDDLRDFDPGAFTRALFEA